MTIGSGSRIGPYEILSLRGAGGMGEVYRARDTRLDRFVAIKILPERLSANEKLRARFEREARAISALAHPNICALYDTGREDGSDYLVMEYLEGETLAERLARGPIPVSALVRYGAQISEGLHHAHRAGITHRDLKPGNIMITSAGAKLLDFGLAKFIEPAHRVFSEESDTWTKVDPITAEGSIVGTTYYMSPEQLEGKTVDHRTDIFSLGVVLYEMATGQRPFRGESSASLVAAILSSDPISIRSLRPDVAAGLERIVLTAIEKSPEERWQTAHDVGRQLRWLAESSTPTGEVAGVRRRRVPLAVAVLITALATGILTWLVADGVRPSKEVVQKTSLHLAPHPGLAVRHPELVPFTISPDGRTVAFVARGDGSHSIYLRRLDSLDVRRVEGSEDAQNPFWSSDGEWLGFSSRGKLWKTRITGGASVEPICDITPFGARASWSGGTILFADSRGERNEIYRVADTGGTPERVTVVKGDEFRHSWPLLLPDGIHFLYVSFAAGTIDREIRLASLNSSEESLLLRNISFVRPLGADRLAYVREGRLLAQRFDAGKGITIGEPETIATDVAYFYKTARAEFDTSRAGVAVYRTDTSTGKLLMMDREGVATRTVDDGVLVWDHSLSPNGKKAAVSVVTRDTGLMDIWVYDLARGVRDRFTSEPAIEVSPTWTPDGKSIVYSQGEGGVFPHLVLRGLSDSTSQDLTPRGSFQFSPAFAPDGESLYFDDNEGRLGSIFRMSMKTKAIEPFVATKFEEKTAAVSPDNKWVAYSSAATGAWEIYLQSPEGDEPVRIRVSNAGGTAPAWRADGSELFFVGPNGAITSAVPGAGRWDDATLHEVFRVPNMNGFSVMPDGQSFLVSTWTTGASDDILHVILGL